MAFSGYFSRDELQQLAEAFTSMHVFYDKVTRKLLFAGLPWSYVAGIVEGPSQKIQLLTDLQNMNGVERLPDGSVPMRVWLSNAATIYADHVGAAQVFNSMLNKLTQRFGGNIVVPAGNTLASLQPPVRPQAIKAENDTIPVAFLRQGVKAIDSVGKILVPAFQNGAPIMMSVHPAVFWGTAWLITSDLAITNQHVIKARDDGDPSIPVPTTADWDLQAANATIQFDYEAEDRQTTSHAVKRIEAMDADLDFALLRLETGLKLNQLPWRDEKLSIAPGSGGFYANIIQHPEGKPKRVAVRNNMIYQVTGDYIQYFTDTSQGSSGSPVFNDRWEVIALHHGTFYSNFDYNYLGRTSGWVNQGTTIEAILTHLETNAPAIYGEILQARK